MYWFYFSYKIIGVENGKFFLHVASYDWWNIKWYIKNGTEDFYSSEINSYVPIKKKKSYVIDYRITPGVTLKNVISLIIFKLNANLYESVVRLYYLLIFSTLQDFVVIKDQ